MKKILSFSLLVLVGAIVYYLFRFVLLGKPKVPDSEQLIPVLEAAESFGFSILMCGVIFLTGAAKWKK